jgi:type I site-specific restriction endonuclease
MKELTNHEYFKPIRIASNKEPLKLISDKVIRGLHDSEIVIPILTSQSISTQWINQEIGFAQAKDKKIIPIVEKEVIDSLKGFIHKQADLSYSYNRNSRIGQENKAFINCFRLLLADLEIEYNLKAVPTVIEPSIPSIADKATEIQKIKEANSRRTKFVNSWETVEISKKEVVNIIEIIREELGKLRGDEISSRQEECNLSSPVRYVLQSEINSFSVEWIEKVNGDARAGSSIVLIQ